jgi:membrane fusion protein, multidrug efflux system
MSCIMKIANYENNKALVVPVSVIQKTSEGDVVYVAKDGKARAVTVAKGRNSNGNVEILSGLEAGDKVIIAGFEDLENGEAVAIQ